MGTLLVNPQAYTHAAPVPVVSIADHDSAAAWDEFVESRPDATGYHAWRWRTIFEEGLNHRPRYLVAKRANRIVGVLPLVEIRGWLFGRALSSLPFVNYGGVLASDREAATALIEAVRPIARAARSSYVLLRHRQRVFNDLPVRTHKVTMLLQLEGNVDAMWTALDRKVRNQIRKAEKSNLELVSGGAELLDQFFNVFARNMRDLGTPVYGRRLFASILSTCGNDARLYVVRLRGEPIAVGLSYSYGSVTEVPSASSLREHRALCPNHLMYWSIVRDAIAHGRRTLDFGRSTPDDGTHQFKEQWGAVSEQLHWEYVLTGAADAPGDDRHSPKYRALIEGWKRLPISVATVMGPHIARCVP